LENTIKDITEYCEEYQEHIEKLKKKKKEKVDYENRTRLIQLMCDRLRERSLVDKLLVSVFGPNANHSISERDLGREHTK
ncbi:hypothetical protein J3Q64DRAFT_1642946, partial [Phycomyces blakesleeanus]